MPYNFLFFLILSVVPFVLSSSGCPGGYELFNDFICVKLFTTATNYRNARSACQSDTSNGNLVSIRNAIDNRRLAQMAAGQNQAVWIGLQCQYNPTPSNCYWENYGDASEYSNFAPGNPAPSQPVTMITFGANAGKWYSADGDQTLAAYFCQTPVVNSCAYPFGDYCYTPYASKLQFLDAQKVCQSACGDLVSIHSQEENDYVFQLGSNTRQTGAYIHIGATTLPSRSWIDGSPWNFANFGYLNTDIGRYLGMAVTSDAVVGLGKWVSNEDEAFFNFVCKTAKNASCGGTLEPTVTPMGCDGGQFFTGNGTIYSPNYPYTYATNSTKCTYVITAHKDYYPTIEFLEFVLDSNAQIAVYEYIDDKYPALMTLSSRRLPSGVIQSGTNLLRLVFSRQVSSYTTDFEWKALYSYTDHQMIVPMSTTRSWFQK